MSHVSSAYPAGVRGTTFFLDATKPDQHTLCLCQGDVDLAATGAKKDQHLHTGADEHTGYSIARTGKKVAVKRMGTMKDSDNHPNARREQLRALAPK